MKCERCQNEDESFSLNVMDESIVENVLPFRQKQ